MRAEPVTPNSLLGNPAAWGIPSIESIAEDWGLDAVRYLKAKTYRKMLDEKLKAETERLISSGKAEVNRPFFIAADTALWADVDNTTVYGAIYDGGRQLGQDQPYSLVSYDYNAGEWKGIFYMPKTDATGAITGVEQIVLDKNGLSGKLAFDPVTFIEFKDKSITAQASSNDYIFSIGTDGTARVSTSDDQKLLFKSNLVQKAAEFNLPGIGMSGSVDPHHFSLGSMRYGEVKINWRDDFKNPQSIDAKIFLGGDRNVTVGYRWPDGEVHRTLNAALKLSGGAFEITSGPEKMTFTSSITLPPVNTTVTGNGALTVSRDQLTGKVTWWFSASLFW